MNPASRTKEKKKKKKDNKDKSNQNTGPSSNHLQPTPIIMYSTRKKTPKKNPLGVFLWNKMLLHTKRFENTNQLRKNPI